MQPYCSIFRGDPPKPLRGKMTSSSLVLLVCTEVETLRRSGETMEISFRANSRCYSPSVLNMEAGDIEGFLFVLSSYNPPSLKMKPN